MPKTLKVAVLMGGKSAEHEVSLRSARNVIAALQRAGHRVVPMKVARDGRMTRGDLAAVFGRRVDAVFPVLHGTYGEDGTFQGLLRAAGVPYVGCDTLSSAVCMDKEFAKRLLKQAGIPTPDFAVLRRTDRRPSLASLRLGRPVFVKPANLGSSVGVHKVRTQRELDAALRDAFRYDHKALVERAVAGRELECSVLGNNHPQASAVGEVVPAHEFYDYDAKYTDENGARLDIPAQLPAAVVQRVQAIAVAAFRALGCAGMARVDFFLARNGELYVNELNTIPGFTDISMYPKLWEAAGLPYDRLVDRLVRLAVERHAADAKLKTSYV